jgi:hypothetical protein
VEQGHPEEHKSREEGRRSSFSEAPQKTLVHTQQVPIPDSRLPGKFRSYADAVRSPASSCNPPAPSSLLNSERQLRVRFQQPDSFVEFQRGDAPAWLLGRSGSLSSKRPAGRGQPILRAPGRASKSVQISTPSGRSKNPAPEICGYGMGMGRRASDEGASHPWQLVAQRQG